jgi:hypothetical protein
MARHWEVKTGAAKNENPTAGWPGSLTLGGVLDHADTGDEVQSQPRILVQSRRGALCK